MTAAESRHDERIESTVPYIAGRTTVTLDSRAERGDWEKLVGPVASVSVAAEMLGISIEDLTQRMARGAVLAVPAASGQLVVVLDQFDVVDGKPVVNPVIEELGPRLVAANSQSGAVRWLATPNRHLSGRSPWAAIWDGDTLAVSHAAERQIRSWEAR